MYSSRHGAISARRVAGRHRRPSRASVVVPAGVTGGVLMASAATGLATAAPAAANEKAAVSQTTQTSADAQQTSTGSNGLPSLPHNLTKGDSGRYVELAQARLGVATDGIFGPITEAAVIRFQRQNDLAVDGVIGPNTWSALEDAESSGDNGNVSLISNTSDSDDSASSLAQKAIEIASEQEGIPYAYGGASPSEGFDCSGLVKYVYGQLGYSLPHNADMQYDEVNHVSQSDLQPGDIVFLADSSGEIYHNGIYAGDGEWWVARHSGTTVTKQTAYWMDGGYDWRVGRVG